MACSEHLGSLQNYVTRIEMKDSSDEDITFHITFPCQVCGRQFEWPYQAAKCEDYHGEQPTKLGDAPLRIVQITSTATQLLALCDDGSLWCKIWDEDWREIEGPVRK